MDVTEKENILHFEEDSRLIPSPSGHLTPESAAAAGSAVGAAMGKGSKLCVSHSTEEGACALAYAFASGAASSGADCIFMGSASATGAAYAAGILGCTAGCFVHTEITASLGLFSGDGLSLYRSTERRIEKELSSSRSLPYSHYGKITVFDKADELYAAELSRQISEPYKDIRADIYSSSERLLDVCKKALSGKNDPGGTRIAFRISADGKRVSAYSEDTGYVFCDKLIMLCCREIFEKGEDCAVCGSVPKALEKLAAQYGRQVISCGSCVCSEEESPSADCLKARSLASKQLFMHDGAALALTVPMILTKRGITLKEAVESLPNSAGVNRFIPVNKPSELLERLCTRAGGTLTDGDGGRVTIRPVRTGKGVMLSVESYALEAASELCDIYAEIVQKAKSISEK